MEHQRPEPPRGEVVRVMVRTGTIIGDGGPHQAVGGDMVQGRVVLLRVSLKGMDTVLEQGPVLDPGMDMGLVVVVLVLVVMGMEAVRGILVAVVTVVGVRIIITGYPPRLGVKLKPPMGRKT